MSGFSVFMLTIHNVPRGVDYVSMDSVPYDEECTPVGSFDNEKWNKVECSIFIKQLVRLNPEMASKCRITMMKNYHDAGIYYDLVILYKQDDEEAEDAAFWFEGNMPDNWDNEAIRELEEAEHPLYYNKIVQMKRA